MLERLRSIRDGERTATVELCRCSVFSSAEIMHCLALIVSRRVRNVEVLLSPKSRVKIINWRIKGCWVLTCDCELPSSLIVCG